MVAAVTQYKKRMQPAPNWNLAFTDSFFMSNVPPGWIITLLTQVYLLIIIQNMMLRQPLLK